MLLLDQMKAEFLAALIFNLIFNRALFLNDLKIMRHCGSRAEHDGGRAVFFG
jgi:hypothetical protein